MSASSQASGGAGPSGVIHDIGYRTYEGPRIGRPGIVRALYWHSLRSAFGIGRGGKAKAVPIIAFVIMCLPALVNAFTMADTGVRAINYDEYIYRFQLILVVYLAAVAPELISRDLRNRTLPLYFSRPLRRSDYPLAKVAAMITALGALTMIPMILLYAGTVGSLHGGSQVWDETRAFLPGLGICVLYSVVFAVLATVLACFTGRRAFATGSIAVAFFGTFIISSSLVAVSGGFDNRFDDMQTATSTGAQVAGLLSPTNLVEGLRLWIAGHEDPRRRTLPYPDTLGPIYLLVTLALTGLCLLILIRRYRKAGLL